jgi:hypothetical protein
MNLRKSVIGLLSCIALSTSAIHADEIFPLTHCRMVDTRFSTPHIYMQLGQAYTFSAVLPDNSIQGGEPTNCGVPIGASAIVASLVTVNPSGPGYLKTWDNGGIEPDRATALNFFKVWDVAISNYPVSPGRLAIIKLSSAGTFNVEAFWFGAYLTVDVEAYLMP